MALEQDSDENVKAPMDMTFYFSFRKLEAIQFNNFATSNVTSTFFMHYKLAEIGDYRLDEDQLPANAQGVISNVDPIVTVIYVYKKSVPAPDIKVVYVDQDGNEIALPKTISGNVGDSYDATTSDYKLTIAGYQLDESKLPANAAQGSLTGDAQTIIYTYIKEEHPVEPTTPSVDTGNQTSSQPTFKEAVESSLPKTGESGMNTMTSIALGTLLVVFSLWMLGEQKKTSK